MKTDFQRIEAQDWWGGVNCTYLALGVNSSYCYLAVALVREVGKSSAWIYNKVCVMLLRYVR